MKKYLGEMTFYPAIKNSGTQVNNNQLLYDGNSYQIDFADLESKFKAGEGYPSQSSRAKLIILCSPHNPIGKVWAKDELMKLGKICLENDAIIISDEIHADFIFRGHEHIPFSSLSEELAHVSITMMAPSKSFNIPGLPASVIIIPNSKIRKLFSDATECLLNQGSIFGLVALKAAYTHGEDWLKAQLEYLQRNMELALEYFREKIPQINAVEPEGTYLLWLDCHQLEFDPQKLEEFMINEARVGLDSGTWFGPGGEGFMRLNIACPRSLLEEGLHRIEEAIKTGLGKNQPGIGRGAKKGG